MLFDLDGTLIDSAPDLIAALNWLRDSAGLPPLATQAMSQYVSHGAMGILRAGMPASSEAQFSQWKALFLQRYAEQSYRESRLYDGVAEVLRGLQEKGIPWGIVTNKFTHLTGPILVAAGLAGKVGCVVCGDTLDLPKPDPAPVLFACQQLGIAPAETLFAGDDIRDIEAGRTAGSMTAAVMYGYGSHEFDGRHLEGSFRIEHPLGFLELLE
jgi:2-phosphoglycolate phosphatase